MTAFDVYSEARIKQQRQGFVLDSAIFTSSAVRPVKLEEEPTEEETSCFFLLEVVIFQRAKLQEIIARTGRAAQLPSVLRFLARPWHSFQAESGQDVEEVATDRRGGHGSNDVARSAVGRDAVAGWLRVGEEVDATTWRNRD